MYCSIAGLPFKKKMLMECNKMGKQKIPHCQNIHDKIHQKIVERGKIDTTNTQIHDLLSDVPCLVQALQYKKVAELNK
jgi:hypothetical protein